MLALQLRLILFSEMLALSALRFCSNVITVNSRSTKILTIKYETPIAEAAATDPTFKLCIRKRTIVRARVGARAFYKVVACC